MVSAGLVYFCNEQTAPISRQSASSENQIRRHYALTESSAAMIRHWYFEVIH
jgi:hypothetical protein